MIVQNQLLQIDCWRSRNPRVIDVWAVGICAVRKHGLSWIPLTDGGSLVEVLQDRYACGAVLDFLDGV